MAEAAARVAHWPPWAGLQASARVPSGSGLDPAAEERAAQLLRQAGYHIVARNFRCRTGELDIIARRAGQLIIAEVRLRSSDALGGPAASIGAAKRQRIVRATRYLLLRRPGLANLAVRFDTLLLTTIAAPIDWIEGAFRAD